MTVMTLEEILAVLKLVEPVSPMDSEYDSGAYDQWKTDKEEIEMAFEMKEKRG